MLTMVMMAAGGGRVCVCVMRADGWKDGGEEKREDGRGKENWVAGSAKRIMVGRRASRAKL